jgi:Putative Flp pilus-assembly TadE/G-like
MARRDRETERGQVVILAALMAVAIIGAAALAVDLSINTFHQRTLQNVSDAAALAGAADLGAQPTATQQQQAVSDALLTIQKNQSFPAGWTGAATATACGSGYCENVTYGNYTVAVSTPPQNARGAVNAGSNNLEVDVTQSAHNGFGAVVGVPTSTIAAHSVGNHSGPPAPYSFAFFARILTGSGNQQETINGDAFVGNGYSPQSAGKAGLCVYEIANGTQGHIVFGTVPPSTGPEPSYGQSPGSSPCTGGNAKGALSAQAPAPQSISPTNCPSPSTPYQDISSGTWLCSLANPSVPNVVAPMVGQGAGTTLGCGSVVASSTPAGVYGVAANCGVTLDFSSGNINCVSLVMGAGSSVSITNKKGQNYITSYGFNPAGDTVADNDITGIGATVPASACGGAGINADNSVIWAPNTTTSPMPVALSNGSTGCCSDTLFVGSIFLPGQEINFTTNQAMEDAGSVYCGNWQVQSGNHPNPAVSFDSADTAFVAEVLKLVE